MCCCASRSFAGPRRGPSSQRDHTVIDTGDHRLSIATIGAALPETRSDCAKARSDEIDYEANLARENRGGHFLRLVEADPQLFPSSWRPEDVRLADALSREALPLDGGGLGGVVLRQYNH
jgi:hypothetical protein